MPEEQGSGSIWDIARGWDRTRVAAPDAAGADQGTPGSIWGVTAPETRNSIQRFFLPTKDVNLIRKSRTQEMEGDVWVAIAVWLFCIFILWRVVIKPFMEKRKAGIVIDVDGDADADKKDD
mmetsp:Transcript_37763/g.87173  ORF Transcript_37763/g.87173 Transcript_37763/m.87173 type:complete len:121 (+) Transcript_37763:95-457(+)